MGFADDPCRCSTIINPGGGTTTNCNGDCIFAPHMLLVGDDSIYPCDVTKTVLFDEDCLDDCGCGTLTPTFELDSYSTNLKDVSVDVNGITFTSDAPDVEDGYIADITYIMRCGRLSSRGSLTIVFNNRCANVACPEGYACDKCTGACVSEGADLDVT